MAIERRLVRPWPMVVSCYVVLEGAFGYDNRIEAMRREGLVDDDTPLYTVKTNVTLLQGTDPVDRSSRSPRWGLRQRMVWGGAVSTCC